MKGFSANLLYKRHGNQIEFARLLRKQSTRTEKILWSYLRNRQQNGKKFRRQHPLRDYIVDFYCHELKVVIEVDGEIHHSPENRAYDEGRTKLLNEIGLRVIRFTNEEVLNNLPSVLEKINKLKKSSFSYN